MNQIQIPAGSRDFMPGEIRRKRKLKETIEHVFAQSGCRPISTPAMEYMQTYTAAFSDADVSEMFGIQDSTGDMLALRLDMTVPIARTASTKLRDRRPLRLFYTEDVFKRRKLFGGKRSQVTDCGVEMIGLPEAGDLEILSLACRVMDAIGRKEWILETGDVRFFGSAVEALGLDEDTRRELADLIDGKSLPDLEAYLDSHGIPQKAFFLELPLLSGGEEVLRAAMEVAFTDEQRACVARLDQLMSQLESLGFGGRLTVDLGKVPHLDYYTSLIFEAYCPNIGTSVLSGGRYDRLLEKFGAPEPACGFSVKLDYLTETEPEQPVPEAVIIRTGPGHEVEALRLADRIRKERPAVIEYMENGQLEVLE